MNYLNLRSEKANRIRTLFTCCTTPLSSSLTFIQPSHTFHTFLHSIFLLPSHTSATASLPVQHNLFIFQDLLHLPSDHVGL